MMQRLGDARGRDVLREHERITRETLRHHSGAEIKTMGDGFMASFGSVTSALECAIALQQAFAAHTESMPEALHVRVGLNAGEPIQEDGDLFGATVILASRICARPARARSSSLNPSGICCPGRVSSSPNAESSCQRASSTPCVCMKCGGATGRRLTALGGNLEHVRTIAPVRTREG